MLEVRLGGVRGPAGTPEGVGLPKMDGSCLCQVISTGDSWDGVTRAVLVSEDLVLSVRDIWEDWLRTRESRRRALPLGPATWPKSSPVVGLVSCESIVASRWIMVIVPAVRSSASVLVVCREEADLPCAAAAYTDGRRATPSREPFRDFFDSGESGECEWVDSSIVIIRGGGLGSRKFKKPDLALPGSLERRSSKGVLAKRAHQESDLRIGWLGGALALIIDE